jgi:hypothetical protein
MGVNSNVYLDAGVQVRDVADVIGILAGLKPYKRHFSGSVGWSTEVDGVKLRSCDTSPEMCEIILTGDLVDGEKGHYVNYFFEIDEGKYRYLYPKATPFWIAISKELCKFFGGKIDYCDCDEGGINARWKKPRKKNAPQDGKPWYNFQQEKLDLKPITIKDMIWANKWAGYKMEEFVELDKMRKICTS